MDHVKPESETNLYAPGTPVFPRHRTVGIGHLTGKKHRCTLTGCRGLRLATRWPDGTITYPCTYGMAYTEGEGWRILPTTRETAQE